MDNQESKVIYTIGYASYDLDEFLNIIKSKEFVTIVDVRSVPYSKRYSQFNKESLGTECAKNNVRYIYLGHLLGARQTDREVLFDDGKVDFNKLACSDSFKQGIEQIKHLNETVAPLCILCSEKDPYKCHRSILLGRVLQRNGYQMQHCIGKKERCTQLDIENRLLKEYAGDYSQVSLFEPALSRDEALDKAYLMRNKDISIVVY